MPFLFVLEHVVPYISLSLSPTFQWAVSGEAEQEWRAKEPREDRTNVCPFYSMCKFSFPSLLLTLARGLLGGYFHRRNKHLFFFPHTLGGIGLDLCLYQVLMKYLKKTEISF